MISSTTTRRRAPRAHLDGGNGHGDLAGDKGLATAGGLVVEEDAVDRKHVICLPVIDHAPVRLAETPQRIRRCQETSMGCEKCVVGEPYWCVRGGKGAMHATV